jgi:hypothetical protein
MNLRMVLIVNDPMPGSPARTATLKFQDWGGTKGEVSVAFTNRGGHYPFLVADEARVYSSGDDTAGRKVFAEGDDVVNLAKALVALIEDEKTLDSLT